MKETKFYFAGFWLLLGFILGGLAMAFQLKEPQPPYEDSGCTISLDSTVCVVPLNDSTLYKELQKQGLHHPEIVLAQAKLETGNYSSALCVNSNNLFGLRKSKKEYYAFDTWQESVVAYADFIQRKYDPPEDYYQFLSRIGYAEDLNYINKVKEIVKTI